MNKQILTTEKGNKGITLIALIITIIVLLILAGVSIATLAGNNGVLTKATHAKEETRGASVQEAKDLWKINQEADNQTESATAQTLEELLNDLEEQNLITTEERTTIEETGEVTIGSKTIVFKEKNIADYVKIGDYVDYRPDEVTTPYGKFGETYSGSPDNGNVGQDTTLQWRVLNINNDGTVDLISDKLTSTKVFFSGARGYNNGVAILNDYCKTMYSDTSKGAVGRSLNIEDIQNHMKTNDDGKKAYESYTSDDGTKYKTETYSYSSNKWYPLQWKNDKGVEGESEPKKPTESDIKSYESEDNAKAKETTGDLTVTKTYWGLAESTMSSNFEPADTRDTSKANTIYYELLCNNGSGRYWLASRFVNPSSFSWVRFGLRLVDLGSVGCIDMFTSDSDAYGGYNDYSVRPVVSLPSNVLDLNTDYGTAGKWALK